jgi:hypothetical protein
MPEAGDGEAARICLGHQLSALGDEDTAGFDGDAGGSPPRRDSMRSVPSAASIATARPSRITTAWPTSAKPRAPISENPRAASAEMAAAGAVPPIGPEPARSSGATSATPRTLKPWASKNRTTRRST